MNQEFNIAQSIANAPDKFIEWAYETFPDLALAIYENFYIIKTISGIISLALFIFIIFLIIKSNFIAIKIDRFSDATGFDELSRRRNIRAWNGILKNLRAADPDHWRVALRDADKILDEILKLAGYQGSNLNERLDNISAAQISNIEELRVAHQFSVRANKEPDFQLTKETVDEAIYIYSQTFKELRLLS